MPDTLNGAGSKGKQITTLVLSVSMRLPQRVMEVHGGLLWQAGLIWRPGQWNVTDGCVKWLTKGWVQQGQTGHRDDHYSALLKCVYVFILFYFTLFYLIFIVVLASVLRDS